MVLQRQMIITPTCYFIEPSQFQISNQTLRKYKTFQDYFIRLSINDDNRAKPFYFGYNTNMVPGYINLILKQGVKFFNFDYQFLSYSNSQLKNYSSWFFNRSCRELRDYEIVEKMGNFDQETNILKRYARRGQILSTSIKQYSQDEYKYKVKVIKDIVRKGQSLKLTPSDGCGYIS